MGERYPQRRLTPPSDATEVILVRHGASAPAVRGEPFPLTGGLGDPPLAPEGERQAMLIAARLARAPLDALFVTPLRRTSESAAPLAEQIELEPQVIPELREVNLGDWEGGELRIRTAHRDPLALRVIAEERWDLIPNAEPMDRLARRVAAGLATVVERLGPGGLGAAFLHGGVIGELCRQATSSRPFAFVHSDNASISRIVRFADGRLLLRSFNDTAHLDDVGGS